MNTDDRVGALHKLKEVIAKSIGEELDRATRTCINCAHFDEPNEVCAIANGQRPPARVIATGCSSHDDVIPF